MQLDALLEVAIGLVFVWIILSVATSEIKELIGRWLNLRSQFLAQTVMDMFKNDKQLIEQFYNHPAIVELCKKDKNGNLIKPEHIPNDVFAEATMDILLNAGKEEGAETHPAAMSYDVMQESKAETKKTVSPAAAQLVDRLFPEPAYAAGSGMSFGIGEFKDQLEGYRKNVSRWFDHVMEQSSDWYKKNAQNWAFAIGIVLALIFNIDTINIANQLWREPTVRAALVSQAQNNADAAATLDATTFETLAIPVGWTTVPAENVSACNSRITNEGRVTLWVGSQCSYLANVPAVNNAGGWILKLVGFLLSALAARQGAPFWFDILKKMVSTRESIKGTSNEAKG